jgi:predicted lysophospholipase L1 biosynthesis ABC-type transport system permease subunit
MNVTGRPYGAKRRLINVAIERRSQWRTVLIGIVTASCAALLVTALAVRLIRPSQESAAAVLFGISVPAGLIAGALAPIVQWAMTREPHHQERR